MSRKQSPIFARTYDLLRWLIPMTIKFPRQHRFVLAAALQRTAMALQERLVEAAFAADPRALLRQADVSLAKLRLYLRLAHDLELLSSGQFAHASTLMAEVGRLLGGWQASLQNDTKSGK